MTKPQVTEQSQQGAQLMVMVHHFRVWDATNDVWVYPPLKSPESRIIKEAKGQIISGTAEDVDLSQLDEFGRYDPMKGQGKPHSS